MARVKVGTVVTPFPYIGGKKWLREKLNKEVNFVLKDGKINTYCEPFCGALGAFLNVHQSLLDNGIKEIYLSDVNTSLINFHQSVLSQPDLLIKEFMFLEYEFEKSLPIEAVQYQAEKGKKDKVKMDSLIGDAPSYFFSKVRSEFNVKKLAHNKDSETDPIFAAQLMFLQKHCFNGVYRENSKGLYNVPFNRTPVVFLEKDISSTILKINEIFNKFQKVIISLMSYKEINFTVANRLYYLDPPYVASGETVGKNKYHKDPFEEAEQIDLIHKLSDINFIYSNHQDNKLKDLFDVIAPNHHYTPVPRKNIISGNKESRTTDKEEMVITRKLDFIKPFALIEHGDTIVVDSRHNSQYGLLSEVIQPSLLTVGNNIDYRQLLILDDEEQFEKDIQSLKDKYIHSIDKKIAYAKELKKDDLLKELLLKKQALN